MLMFFIVLFFYGSILAQGVGRVLGNPLEFSGGLFAAGKHCMACRVLLLVWAWQKMLPACRHIFIDLRGGAYQSARTLLNSAPFAAEVDFPEYFGSILAGW